MFLLNNNHDRKYAATYPSIRDVIFDLSDAQIKNATNHDWNDIGPGSLVCVINSSRKISRFCVVTNKEKTDVVDEKLGNFHVITGRGIARLSPDRDMQPLLNSREIIHNNLRKNYFRIGVNVVNLGDSLDKLELSVGDKSMGVGVLKKHLAAGDDLAEA
jgi:hypothetical protein